MHTAASARLMLFGAAAPTAGGEHVARSGAIDTFEHESSSSNTPGSAGCREPRGSRAPRCKRRSPTRPPRNAASGFRNVAPTPAAKAPGSAAGVTLADPMNATLRRPSTVRLSERSSPRVRMLQASCVVRARCSKGGPWIVRRSDRAPTQHLSRCARAGTARHTGDATSLLRHRVAWPASVTGMHLAWLKHHRAAERPARESPVEPKGAPSRSNMRSTST
jgi:hypothetical protein